MVRVHSGLPFSVPPDFLPVFGLLSYLFHPSSANVLVSSANGFLPRHADNIATASLSPSSSYPFLSQAA